MFSLDVEAAPLCSLDDTLTQAMDRREKQSSAVYSIPSSASREDFSYSVPNASKMIHEGDTARYSKVSWISPWIYYLQQHERDMEHNPSRACRRLALCAATAGVALAGARGLVAATLSPALSLGERVFACRAVFQTCVPLYVLPFVLVSQYDCWTAVAERRAPRRRRWHNDAANDLG